MYSFEAFQDTVIICRSFCSVMKNIAKGMTFFIFFVKVDNRRCWCLYHCGNGKVYDLNIYS